MCLVAAMLDSTVMKNKFCTEVHFVEMAPENKIKENCIQKILFSLLPQAHCHDSKHRISISDFQRAEHWLAQRYPRMRLSDGFVFLKGPFPAVLRLWLIKRWEWAVICVPSWEHFPLEKKHDPQPQVKKSRRGLDTLIPHSPQAHLHLILPVFPPFTH